MIYILGMPCSLRGLLPRNTARRATSTAVTGLSQKATWGQTSRGGRRVISEPRMATAIFQEAAARASDLATWSESADGGGVSDRCLHRGSYCRIGGGATARRRSRRKILRVPISKRQLRPLTHAAFLVVGRTRPFTDGQTGSRHWLWW